MSNDTKWLDIKKDYLKRTVNGEKVVLSQLAKEHGVKASTLRSRKNRENWDDFLKSVATEFKENNKSVATGKVEENNQKSKTGNRQKQNTDTDIDRANLNRRINMLGNTNAINNKGGPGAKKGNKYAEKHGFYSEYLPEETMALFNDLEEMNELDLLWDSIKLKYAAIIRAQKIMFVADKNDTTKEIKKLKTVEGMSLSEEKEWEIQFAWDKYSTFLQAQSRAMGELRSLIKQYNDLIDKGLATREQELRIKKLEVEIDNMTSDKDGQESEDWVNAIKEIAAKRKKESGKDG